MQLDLPERIPVFVATAKISDAGAVPRRSDGALLVDVLDAVDREGRARVLPALDRVAVIAGAALSDAPLLHLLGRERACREERGAVPAVLDAGLRIASGECDLVAVIGLGPGGRPPEPVGHGAAFAYALYDNARAAPPDGAAPMETRAQEAPAAAAIVLASLAWARGAGLDDGRLVYLWGGGTAIEADDPWHRDRFDRCTAQDAVLHHMIAVVGGAERFSSVTLSGGHPVVGDTALAALALPPHAPATLRCETTMVDIRQAIVALHDRARGHAMVYAEEGGFARHHGLVVALDPPPFLVQPVDVQEKAEEARAPVPPLLADYAGPAAYETGAPVPLPQGGLAHWQVAVLTPERQRVVCRIRPDDAASLRLLADPAAPPLGAGGHVRTDAFGALVWEAGVRRPLAGTRPRFCTVEREGRLTIVTIARPDAMNALDPDTNEELAEIFDMFDADPEQWVAILTGAGDRAFSAGADLKHALAAMTRGAEIPVPVTGIAGLTARWNSDKPVIAAVNGLAMGGGFEVALACDILIAAEDACFGLPEPRVGQAAIGGGLLRLPREIGMKRAMDMILTGKTVSAAEGLALGFVNEVVPRAGLMAAARRRAEAILACAPLSVRASKQAVLAAAGETDLRAAYAHQLGYPAMRTLFASDDAREGPRAFAQKRPPDWTAR